MLIKTVVVKNNSGLHARPATMVVKEASKYRSEIMIINGTIEVNAKSIMGIMAMGANKGQELELRIDGSDEKEALEALGALFETNFDE